jgi:hypothetical protein
VARPFKKTFATKKREIPPSSSSSLDIFSYRISVSESKEKVETLSCPPFLLARNNPPRR